MDYATFKTALATGEFDEHLDDIAAVIKRRRDANAPQIWDFIEGQTVKVNNKANPHYMRGALAVVKKVNRTRLVIDLNEPRGRFHKNITIPLTLVEQP